MKCNTLRRPVIAGWKFLGVGTKHKVSDMVPVKRSDSEIRGQFWKHLGNTTRQKAVIYAIKLPKCFQIPMLTFVGSSFLE